MTRNPGITIIVRITGGKAGALDDARLIRGLRAMIPMPMQSSTTQVVKREQRCLSDFPMEVYNTMTQKFHLLTSQRTLHADAICGRLQPSLLYNNVCTITDPTPDIP
jgi:hypothetical protein